MRRDETTARAPLSFRAEREILLNFYGHSSLVGVRARKISPEPRGRVSTRPYKSRFFCDLCVLCGQLSASESSIYVILVPFVVKPLIRLGYGSAALGSLR
jgi:hypothetical protein